MKVRNVELPLLLLLAGGGVWYLLGSMDFLEAGEQDFFLNPGFFPAILACALLVFIAISILQTFLRRSNRQDFPVNNAARIVAVLALTAVYIWLWSSFSDLFYVTTVLFFLAVSLVLSVRKDTKVAPLIVRNGIVALVLAGLIYLVFDLVFGISIT
jgi:uncharacterized membrane protein (DUF373 family)